MEIILPCNCKKHISLLTKLYLYLSIKALKVTYLRALNLQDYFD